MAIATRDGLAQAEGGAVSKSRMFPIDGREYEIPLLNSLDLDEELILFDISGVLQRHFVPAHPEATDEEKLAVELAQIARLEDPRFKRAMVHIAFRRGNRGLTFEEIEDVIGKVPALDTEIPWLGGDADPPTSSPKQPESKRSTSDPSSSSDSGTSSGSDSERAAEILPLTGTGR